MRSDQHDFDVGLAGDLTGSLSREQDRGSQAVDLIDASTPRTGAW